MKNKIKNTLKELEKNKKMSRDELNNLLRDIKIFQHERLIHLLVTIFVGLATILFFGIAFTSNILEFGIVGIITLIMFVFYIFYYYFLENSIQKIYEYYWKARDK